MGTYTYTGLADDSQDWTQPKNWSPESVPPGSPADVIIFDANTAVRNVPDDFPAAELHLNFGSQLNGVSGAGSIIVGSVLDVAPLTEIDIDLTSNGTGTVQTGTDPEQFPTFVNSHKLTNNGSLTITGGGQWSLGGGTPVTIDNPGTVTFDNAGLLWSGGSDPQLINRGTLSIVGSCEFLGSNILHTGHLDFAGGTLLLHGATNLHLQGGDISGNGKIVVGGTADDLSYLTLAADAVIPNQVPLELDGQAHVVFAVPAGSPEPTLTINSSLHCVGGGQVAPVYLIAHLVLPPQAPLTISGTYNLVGTGADQDGFLETYGVTTFETGGELDIDVGSTFLNHGRITLSATAQATSLASTGLLDNRGMIEKVGTGTDVLGCDVSNTGHIIVRGGTLELDATVTINDGDITLAGGDITGSGQLILAGGTTGGALRGSGSVAVPVTNAAWVEPTAGGLTLTQGYTQQDTGNLVVAQQALGGPNVPVSVTGQLMLAGSLWVTDA